MPEQGHLSLRAPKANPQGRGNLLPRLKVNSVLAGDLSAEPPVRTCEGF